MKRIAIAALLIFAVCTCVFAQGTPKAQAGGGLFFDVLPVTRQGHVLVPMRAIFEWIGAKVEYDAGTVKAYEFHSMVPRVELTIGDRAARLSGEPYELAVAPEVIGGRTFVPMRFSAEAYGVWVDVEGRTITMQYPQANVKAEMAIPPSPQSHLAKMWQVVARWYDIGGVAPSGGELPHWNLYSDSRQQELRKQVGSDAPTIIESHWGGRAVEGIRVISNLHDLAASTGDVVVFVKWADGAVTKETFHMVLQRDGWKIDSTESVSIASVG
ncbi:MAG: copper amine oxidase N-terminal domain-containing protein [Armatimonadota bacterium]